MISHPRPGQMVHVRYGMSYARRMPLHNRRGCVRVASRGKPRNHGIEIDGRMYSIPAGNLMPVK